MSRAIIGSPGSIATGQVAVGATAVEIVPARPGRYSVQLRGSEDVFIGADNAVTSSTGFNLASATSRLVREIQTEAAIWGIRSTAGSTMVEFLETYD